MSFYFLVLVVALTSILGIVHSQTAREKLHLQSVYDWSVEAAQQQLRNLEIILSTPSLAGDDVTDEVVEIVVVEQTEAAAAAPTLSESIEEIQGIKLGQHQDDDVQATQSSDAVNAASDEDEATGEGVEDRDKVLAAINASLRRLSRAAVSGRLNGAQLYEILLQETKLHEKVANGVRADDDAAGSSRATASPNLTISDGASDEPKMYFGEKPLEYVPHHSSR